MIFESPRPPVAIPDVTLSTFLFDAPPERGSRPAIIDGPSGREITFDELRRDASAAALGLIARGLEPGDMVAICSPNVPEYATAFHGVAMAGGCSTTLNPLQTAGELRHQVADSCARWFITVPALLDKALAVAEATGIEEVFTFGEAAGGAKGGAAGGATGGAAGGAKGGAAGGATGGGTVRAADDPGRATPFAELVRSGLRARASAAAAGGRDPFESLSERVSDPSTHLVTLPYSSGTTGLPKGVMLTHRNLVANVAQYVVADPIREGEVVLAVLPFFHIYGMVVVMSACLAAGATIVTLPRFALETCLATISRYRITRAYVVPPILLALAKHPLVDEHDLSSLERLCSGAAPLGREIADACEARLGCRVFQGYGLTEASPVTHLHPPDLESRERIGSVGPCVSGTEVCIVDLETRERLGAGADGEVWVRGPQVMTGYLNRPDATAATLDADGWLHTGDVGRVDADGFLTIVDRAKELIKYKGYPVPPAELEAVLLSHPRVRDAAVIPSPHPEAGEVPKAFVVASRKVGAEELMAFVAERVAPYKKIRAVEFTDEIPKSASGKILRRVLVERERAAAADAGRA